MILSTENSFLRMHVGERRAIEILAQAGFDAIDYGFSPALERGEMPWSTANYAQYAKEVLKIAEDNGVYFNQAHGPFQFDTSLFPDYSREVLPLCQRCFEACALLKIPHVIIHPVHHIPYLGNEEKLWRMNMEFYRMLLESAKPFGVKIALENMYQYDPRRGVLTTDVFAVPEKYAAFYDALDDQNVTCCVDIGHCSIVGVEPNHMLRTMNRRVGALHVNDNLFRTDDHMIPGHGLMNWNEITKTLAEIDYQGDLTYEVINVYRAYDPEFMPISAKYLHDVGRYLIAKVEGYKKRNKNGEPDENYC